MRENVLYCDLLFLRSSRASDTSLSGLWETSEIGIEKMVAAGFTPQEALQNLTTLSLFTRGCIILERQMQQAGQSPDEPTPISDRFPLMKAALDGQNVRGVNDPMFIAQLRALIDGMVARLALKG